MPIKRKPPGGGGRSRTDHFVYWWTAPTQSWTGWLAGPPYWCDAHTSDHGSKPCLDWITDGKLFCTRCRPNELPTEIGYVPIYRESDGAPKLVIVYDTARDQLEPLKHPDYVRVIREGGEKDTVTVHALPSKKPMNTTLERRKVPIDIVPALIRMWKLPELTEWFRLNAPECVVAPPAEPAEPAPVPVPPGATMLDVARVAGILDANAEADRERAEMKAAMAERMRNWKPTANGKHDPKKPK